MNDRHKTRKKLWKMERPTVFYVGEAFVFLTDSFKRNFRALEGVDEFLKYGKTEKCKIKDVSEDFKTCKNCLTMGGHNCNDCRNEYLKKFAESELNRKEWESK